MEKDYTWVRLYRRITEHELFEDDTAFKVFIWILCRVDYKTGSMKIGRFWGAERLNMNPNTFKSVMTRLSKKYKIITTTGTNKYTLVQVQNWAQYQQPTPPATPTKHQQNTTTQEYKELKNNTVVQEQAFKTKCPIPSNRELIKRYPKGHAECTEFIEGIEAERGKKFISPSKQYARLHQILEAGYDENDMGKVMDALDAKYGVGAWDMDNVANWLEKGGV